MDARSIVRSAAITHRGQECFNHGDVHEGEEKWLGLGYILRKVVGRTFWEAVEFGGGGEGRLGALL